MKHICFQTPENWTKEATGFLALLPCAGISVWVGLGVVMLAMNMYCITVVLSWVISRV